MSTLCTVEVDSRRSQAKSDPLNCITVTGSGAYEVM